MADVPSVTLALALQERLRSCPGVAGLDPLSRLLTVGPRGRIRGVAAAPDGGDGGDGEGTGLALDLVGLADARLPEAAAAARAAALEVCAAAGTPVDHVVVRMTDVASSPLPPQDPAPPPRPVAPPAPAATETPPGLPAPVPPPPAADPPARPPRPLVSLPSPPPPPPPVGDPTLTLSPGQRVRVELPGQDGVTLALVISVESISSPHPPHPRPAGSGSAP